MSESSNNNNSLQLPTTQTGTDTVTPTIEVPKVEDTTKKEKTMAEFLAMMDNYAPIIPNAVTDYYLNKLDSIVMILNVYKRLLALATQKFVADIATDAFQYCKVRQSGSKKAGKERKTVLTMEDLTAALAEYGVNIKKPDYYS
ncbi:unnamed protein product [Mucor hiemalis]